MLACIIEFGIAEGAEELRSTLLAEMMKEVVAMDGFISKETFESRDKPGKLITLSYWRDEESLQAWMRHRPHARAVMQGRREVFSYYNIEIANIVRKVDWKRPAPPA